MDEFKIREYAEYHCLICGKGYTKNHSAFCPHPNLEATEADRAKMIKFGDLWKLLDNAGSKAAQTEVEPKPRGGHPRFYELVKEITDLHDRKNTDYASGTKEGPLGNFERVSQIAKLYPGFDWDSAFGVAMIYMLKQLDAAFTLRSQKRESVTGEGIATRLRDVTVYSLIGQILVEEENGQNE